MKKIESAMAMIEPFAIQDVVTGIKIKLTVSKQYSVLSIDDRSYYFCRENGKFDGTSKDNVWLACEPGKSLFAEKSKKAERPSGMPKIINRKHKETTK